MHRKARGIWYRVKLKAMLRDTKCSFEARSLWALMEGFANQDGTSCHPSVETLMRLTGKCKRWVEKYLRELKAKGHIRIMGKVKTKKGFYNLYQISYPLTFHYGQTEQEDEGHKMSHGHGPKNGPLPEFNKPECDEMVREDPPIYALPDPELPKAATA